jgi:hypothetical protein
VSHRDRCALMRLRPTTAVGRSSLATRKVVLRPLGDARPDLPHPGAILAVRVGGIEQVPEPVRRPLQQFRLASLIQRAEAQALGGEGVAPQLTVVSVAVEIVVLEPHHTRRVSDDAPNFPIMSSPCVPTPSNGASPFSRGCSVPRSLGRCDCGERRDQSDRWGRGCRLYKDRSRRVGDEERDRAPPQRACRGSPP